MLRRYYAREGAPRICAITGRSRRAVYVRAQVLGVSAYRRWTPREDRVLALEWGEVARRSLQRKLPGRRWGSIVWRAKRLGLGSAAQGRVSVAEAARRAGFSWDAMASILTAAGVRLERFAGGKTLARRSERLVVDPDAADAAVRAHLRRETIAQGARRVGIAKATMRTRMERAGLLRPTVRGRTVYYEPEEIDRACALWVPRPKHPVKAVRS